MLQVKPLACMVTFLIWADAKRQQKKDKNKVIVFLICLYFIQV